MHGVESVNRVSSRVPSHLGTSSVTRPHAHSHAAPIPQTRPQQLNLNRDSFDRTSVVESIQRRVGTTPDGIFGPDTKAAVERFQRARGLEADGIVGKDTFAAMFNQPLPQGIAPFRAGQPSTSAAEPVGGVTRTGTTRRTGAVGDIHAGGGWGGTERLADTAKDIARDMGIGISSTKRTKTTSIGSTSHSDHHVSQRNAYAVDFPVRGARGAELARRIADAYGIRGNVIGNYNKHMINVDGQRYRMQILWGVKGHHDHVHVGFRKV